MSGSGLSTQEGLAARGTVLAAALAASLFAVSAAGGSWVQAPKRGGTVVLWAAPGDEPACITPMIEVCFSGGPFRPLWWSLAPAALAGAFRVGPDLAWEPQLVSDVDYTKKRPFTLTYHIRPEARWSDGVRVSASDFVFTYQTMLRYRPQLSYGYDELLKRIKRVRAPDAQTVQVVVKKRYASWRVVLFMVVLPRHVLAGQDYLNVWRERIENPMTGKPIGSGPFFVSSWERGRRLTLVRNPSYWGPHAAYMERVVVNFDAAREPADAFANGEVNLAPALRPSVIDSLRGVSGLRILTGSDPFTWDHIEIRLGEGGHPLLRSRLVRRAIAYGIDRRRIVRALFSETFPSQRVSESAIFPNSSRHYRPNWSQYRYRPAESRRLLELAGCRRGTDGVYVCAGKRLSLRFATRGDVPNRVRTLELVRSRLSRAGVEVVPEYASQEVLVGQIIPSGDFDLAEFAWIGLMDEAASRIFGCGGYLNYTGYCQRRVTADLDDAGLTFDADKRAEVLNRADAQIASDVPVLPLYSGVGVTAYRTSLHGIVYHPFDLFWNAEDWWLVS